MWFSQVGSHISEEKDNSGKTRLKCLAVEFILQHPWVVAH